MQKKNTINKNEMPAYQFYEGLAESDFFIICDHGGNYFPDKDSFGVKNLGLSDDDRHRHISYDIGAKEVAKGLHEKLHAPLLVSYFSRLYIDVNRPLDDFTSIRVISDGTYISANDHLTQEERENRQKVHAQYHQKARILSENHPKMLSIHSFTPKLQNQEKRPWDIGILSHNFKGLSDMFIQAFRKKYPAIMIGDNQPYSGKDDYSFSIMEYGLSLQRPYLVIELRQDLISDAKGQQKWADIIFSVLQEIKYD